MFLYKSKSGLSMGGSAERRTVAEMEKLVNKSGSTQDLLNYLDEDVPGYSNYRNLYVIGLFTMAIFALPSNIAVMILLYKKLFWKSNVLLLLFQLSIADIFVAFFCILGDAIWNVTIQWNGSDGLCRFYKYMQMFALYASTFILTGISIDRCIAVLFPLSRSCSQGRVLRVRIISVIAWLAALACAAPQAVIFHTETAPFQADFKQCVTHGAYTEQWQELAYSLTTVIIMFFLPVLVMALCYISIFMRITKEARQASETGEYLSQHSTVRKELYSRVRRATLWMTVVFVLCFIVCWGKCRSESHIMP
ncbi:hypothetical protein RvY_13521-2 [Ramazzottius varieornatus]|uniref:G-protein coupled receptors family 1 profile domain-containing protein n=1 Tax=Ramazzottius varieornatus TaxID=947166 RepID=A0A1D1VN70_RAMVA|nr:hypothetical protein RvY_13521-2 [Ramazzottius varieornatus]